MPFARRKQYFARIFNNKFIQGGYTLYERDHFTCHAPPEYPSAPSAGEAGTGRYGQPPGGWCMSAAATSMETASLWMNASVFFDPFGHV